MMESPRQQPIHPKPIRVIVSRAYTVLILVISLVLLLTVKGKKAIDVNKNKFNLWDLASQRYVLIAILLGSACNLSQLGLLIYCMITGKDMANNKYKIFFDYYTDKVMSLLLAASMGAGLGSMLDIKQVHALTNVGAFFPMEKISSALLAIALVSSAISSSCYEEAVQSYRKSLEKGEETVGIFRS